MKHSQVNESKCLRFCIGAFVLFITTGTFALDDKAIRINKNCGQFIKNVIDNNEPEIFGTTNNLFSSTTKDDLERLYADRMIFIGRLFDNRCVPISDAKIYIWQALSNGKFPYHPLRNKGINKSLFMENSNENQHSLGSGTATTDNNGRFVFVALKPNNLNKVTLRIKNFNLTEQIQAHISLNNCNIIEGKCYFDIKINETIINKRF